MDAPKIEALKAMGIDAATLRALLAEVETTEKAAEAEGVRYKAEPVAVPAPEPEPELTLVERFKAFLSGEQQVAAPVAEPEPEPAVDPIAALKAQLDAVQAELATLKAGPPGMLDAEDDPALGGDSGVDEAAEGEPPLDQGGEMSADEFIGAIGDMLDAKLGPLVEALGITTKLDGHMGELKSLLGGFVKTKEERDAAATAQIDQLAAQVADLTGSAPRAASYRASAAPDNLPDQLLAVLKDTPGGDDHPFADQLGQWFPNLAQPR